MNIYTNGFHFAKNNSQEEVMLEFLQTIPTFNDDGKVESVSEETVVSLVMTYSLAKDLKRALNQHFPDAEKVGDE